MFDTQVAAGFLGFGNQEGYESLVRKVLGVKLKGSRGVHALGRRPLTPQQLEYAARRRAPAARPRRGDRAAPGGARAARVGARGVKLAGGVDRRARRRTAIFERLPRLGRLERVGARRGARAGRVARGEARGADRAAGYVLPDQALIELARRAPSDKHGLEQIRGLPPQTLHRRGDALLGAIERGRSARRRRRRPSRARDPPTRRSSRSPRRWCATARWSPAWRWS